MYYEPKQVSDHFPFFSNVDLYITVHNKCRCVATREFMILPDFQGLRGRPGHCRNCGALSFPNPNSLLEDSRELERLCRTENSARFSRRRLRVPLDYPNELLLREPDGLVPLPGSRIGTGFPFALDGRVATPPHRHQISPRA